uniref:Putative secreted protein n=1 Tax=Anopheles darlingi TaxID=43151 RepID=A0A2M4D243_ANODA
MFDASVRAITGAAAAAAAVAAVWQTADRSLLVGRPQGQLCFSYTTLMRSRALNWRPDHLRGDPRPPSSEGEREREKKKK